MKNETLFIITGAIGATIFLFSLFAIIYLKQNEPPKNASPESKSRVTEWYDTDAKSKHEVKQVKANGYESKYKSTGSHNVAIGYPQSSKFKLKEVMHKKIRYKNGSECRIVGGSEDALLNECEKDEILNSNTSYGMESMMDTTTGCESQKLGKAESK